MRSILSLLLLAATLPVWADCQDWRPIETAPKHTYILVSAGYDKIPGWPKSPPYRVTYLAYWAEFLSADGAKEWRNADTHQKLPYQVFKWMPVPREQP